MPNIAINNNTVATSPYVPAAAAVTATGFVTIKGIDVVVEGDGVASHTFTQGTTVTQHLSPTMSSVGQSFVRVGGKLVIIGGDPASCSSSHTITATGFVTITP